MSYINQQTTDIHAKTTQKTEKQYNISRNMPIIKHNIKHNIKISNEQKESIEIRNIIHKYLNNFHDKH